MNIINIIFEYFIRSYIKLFSQKLKENEKNLHKTKLENESLKSKIKEDGEFKERKIKDNTLLGYLFASAFPLALLSHAVKMKAP